MTQSSSFNMFTKTQYYPEILTRSTVQMGEEVPFFLCCMQMMCLVKLFSISFPCPLCLFERLLNAPGSVAFRFWTLLEPCTAILCREPRYRSVGPIGEQTSLSEPSDLKTKIIARLYFYISLNVQLVSCFTVKYLYIIYTYKSILIDFIWVHNFSPSVPLFINH